MKPTWKTLFLAARNIISWGAMGFITLVIILNGYTVLWTGFGDYTTPPGDFVRGKTLWDWMELLIIPFVLAIGAFALNRSEKEIERQRTEERAKSEIERAEERAKLEREIEADRQQQEALQAYLDRMADLLIEKQLTINPNKVISDVARIQTLTVLRGLDGKRKGMVLLFLYEAKLIQKEKPILDLTKADLRGAELTYASLNNSSLIGVDLTDAVLSFANLSMANLTGTILMNADLRGIICDSAILDMTNLKGANLYRAIIRNVDIEKKADLRGATMPDGTIHE